MNNWLATIPKNTLAFLAIAGGILFIVFSSPPHSICDSQIEVIKESQAQFLYKNPPKSKVRNTTKYQMLRDRCRSTNTPGGCYELFQNVRSLLSDLATVSLECGSAVSGVKEVSVALWETAELLVRLAWGEAPPKAYNAKFGWLDTSDVTLFCKLKARLTAFSGEARWNSFREKMMLELPGAKELNRNQIWELILFSENCARFP